MADRGQATVPAVGDGNRARWETYAASVIGADHLRDRTPNQDAVATRRFGLPGPDGLVVLAVADGHGDARHFRSDRGSKLAVAQAISAAGDWASSIPARTMPSRPAASELVSSIVARWRDAVLADLAADPVGGTQAGAIRHDDPPEIPYGATLLLVVIRGDVVVLAQIGDGDIFLVRHDGRLIAPVPGDRTLDGTHTTSLCQPDAVSAFRVALVSLARTPVYAIFAATDGYGNAQAEPDWKARWAADLVSLGAAHGVSWIGEQLRDWVAACASSDGSGDDSTVALALNPAATAARPAPAAPRDRWQVDAGVRDQAVRDGATIPVEPLRQTEPARRSGRFKVPLLQSAASARWWLVAVALAIAVAGYLLVTSPRSGRVHPTPSPTPIHSATRTPATTPTPTPRRTATHTPARTAPQRATRTARQKSAAAKK